MIYIILQTYSKKIDTNGIEIIIILLIILFWYLTTGGQKNKTNNNRKGKIQPIIHKSTDSELSKPLVTKQVEKTESKIKKYHKYPDYIQNKIIDKEFMNSKIELCYLNPYIDLRKYHNEFSFSQYYNGTLEDLDSLKIESDIFGCNLIPEFWYIHYNNLLYIFNGEIIVPCSGIMKRDSDCLISIFYIPIDNKIKISNTFYFEISFYDKISKSISSEESLIDFINKLNYYLSGSLDEYNLVGYNTRFVFQTIFDFKQKIRILDNLNSLEFFTRLYLTKIDYIPINIEKLINSFYNYDTKDNKDIIKITKTSLGILKQEEIIDILISRYNIKEDVLEFFNYDKIEEYLSFSRLKKNHENNTSLLSSDLFYHNYVYNIHYSRRNYSEEKLITDEFRKFKMNYYRTITPKLREIESEVRVGKGFNIVGSFTNESLLFTKIKETYKEYKVISQGSPNWLGRQRIDIYFPELNIGIEYHGDQHFLPIPFFGGEEGLKQRKILDSRKEKLCFENDCKLYCVDKKYSFEHLKNEIDLEIDNRIKNNKLHF